jgi:hypothetical protein
VVTRGSHRPFQSMSRQRGEVKLPREI